MAGPERIRVEVVYALPARQHLVALELPAGSTALEAVRASGLLERDGAPAMDALQLGVFGKPVDAARVLRAGERVEIYRPLKADPKEVRRKLAAEGRSMGRVRDGAE